MGIVMHEDDTITQYARAVLRWPSDFFLFPKLKEQLSGTRLSSESENGCRELAQWAGTWVDSDNSRVKSFVTGLSGTLTDCPKARFVEFPLPYQEVWRIPLDILQEPLPVLLETTQYLSPQVQAQEKLPAVRNIALVAQETFAVRAARNFGLISRDTFAVRTARNFVLFVRESFVVRAAQNFVLFVRESFAVRAAQEAIVVAPRKTIFGSTW
ncbi:hypothetical protein AVEN_252040-1 [Araneus ventricosus]|uniref:Uncharacterized protein n=1 Tax=Araneus ventricosus TaxID=182803 RepID=A0A4Y2JVJ1_ARAVE|nr:hypothetical protein AVEN_252040-1 [Araneus ventricosus]